VFTVTLKKGIVASYEWDRTREKLTEEDQPKRVPAHRGDSDFRRERHKETDPAKRSLRGKTLTPIGLRFKELFQQGHSIEEIADITIRAKPVVVASLGCQGLIALVDKPRKFPRFPRDYA
jgi:hypothetical protein